MSKSLVCHALGLVAAASMMGACYPEEFPSAPALGSSDVASDSASSTTTAGGTSATSASDGNGGVGGVGGLGGFGGFGAVGGTSSEAESGDTGPTELPPCLTAQSHEPLRARLAITSDSVSSGPRPVFTSDLFNLFSSHCGACHAQASLGGFGGEKVTRANFADVVDEAVLEVIRSDDPDQFMPPDSSPAGKAWSERVGADGFGTDAVVEFVGLLEKWFAAGRPRDVFFLEPELAPDTSPFLLSTEVGAELTNIGNCVPPAELYALEASKSDDLDAFFASIDKLPRRLEETDLFTLDTAELARYGVVAFAPAYPLWSDDAGKIRQIRVPRGTSIRYDPESLQFEIPENTRVYKTFLKRVMDAEGNEGWRKIETRLILSRSDDCGAGECRVRALMGSYKWNDAETEAVLVETTYNNGEPFADDVFRYVTDEAQANAALDSLELRAATRAYGIPGRERCIQCHMGAPNKSTILGFTPLQIHRRPYVEDDPLANPEELVGHGVLPTDDPGPDELTQMQRFIDMGLVTGLDDPDEIPSLRESQENLPRTPEELTAQGYLLGNCANCHNPRGFASIRNPVLAPILNFYPGVQGGGIFGFPMHERLADGELKVDAKGDPVPFTSPRIRRGTKPIPYITPSLFDQKGNPAAWVPKEGQLVVSYDPDTGASKSESRFVLAPWRSLIYRNVDTPFTYSDDLAIYPHMPLNAPGFDCRAPRIVADWMVSLPARPDPGAWEGTPGDTIKDKGLAAEPYLEVFPGDPDYEEAKLAARQRLEAYHTGERYPFCPDTSDIVDHEVLDDPEVLVPADHGYVLPGDQLPPLEQQYFGKKFNDNVPDRAHWVTTDLTTAPVEWSPRGADWQELLVWEDPSTPPAALESLPAEEREVIETLQDLSLTDDLAQFALTPVPFALWDAQGKDCPNLVNEPTVSSFPLSERPRWMLQPPQPAATAPVYMLAPGEAIFVAICANCHGPKGDGTGDLATKVLELTGGSTRVANLRDGLLRAENRHRVFGESAGALGLTDLALASRYLAFMALGGTRATIPPLVLTQVANTPVAGTPRLVLPSEASANMLNAAQGWCMHVPAGNDSNFNGVRGFNQAIGGFSVEAQEDFGPVLSNGDMELWEAVCSYDNGAPVRALDLAQATQKWLDTDPRQLYVRDAYPSDALVGDQRGRLRVGLDAANIGPWCVLTPESESVAQVIVDKFSIDGEVPWCPVDYVTPANRLPAFPFSGSELERWARRGAMTAGFSVFAFLDAVATGQVEPRPAYNQCDRL